MEWVTALLAVGCLFIAGQVVVDYLRYRRALEPRLESARSSGEQLRDRMEASRRELARRRRETRARHGMEEEPAEGSGDALQRSRERVRSTPA